MAVPSPVPSVGRIQGVCTAACRYDTEGMCRVCGSLDPSEYVVYRLPTKETAEREQALAAFRRVADALGIDPSILEVRRG